MKSRVRENLSNGEGESQPLEISTATWTNRTNRSTAARNVSLDFLVYKAVSKDKTKMMMIV